MDDGTQYPLSALAVGLGSKFLILLHHLLFPVDPDRSSQSYGRNRTPAELQRIPLKETP
jgi:hypothetical protein